MKHLAFCLALSAARIICTSPDPAPGPTGAGGGCASHLDCIGAGWCVDGHCVPAGTTSKDTPPSAVFPSETEPDVSGNPHPGDGGS